MKKHLVFIIYLIIALFIVVTAIVFPDGFRNVSEQLLDSLQHNFSWLYLLAMLAFVLFSLLIAISKYGTIRLGPDDSRPEFPQTLLSGFYPT